MSESQELLNKFSSELKLASSAFSAQAESALAEAKKAGTLSAETKSSVDEMAMKFNTLTEAEKQLKSQLGELEQEFARMPAQSSAGSRESLGSTVVKSEALAEFAKSLQGNRRVSIPVNAALLSTDVAEGVVEPQRLPGIDVAPKQRLFIRDLIAPGRTTSPAIFWVQQTGFTNNAAPVGENPAGGKPYSEITFDTKITPVTTIAHMFKASKQILDDFAQLQSTVDAEMRYGLKYVEEAQILFGDGIGVNLSGIVPQASAYSAAFTPDAMTQIDELRLAMLQAQLARLPASGHILHFMDWAKIELNKDTLGRYIIGNPMNLASPSLWGLPVVATEIAAFQGKFLTGAFQTGAQIFDREEANVVISTENADDFEKNMISIRCEERLALAVKRPEAFIFGTFTPPAP